MPKIVDGPAPGEFPGLPDMKSKNQAKKAIRVGEAKWQGIKHLIECVRIGNRDFYTDAALLKFIKASTVKPGERAKPREPRAKAEPRRKTGTELRAAGAPSRTEKARRAARRPADTIQPP